MKITSKEKITESDISELVDITLAAMPIVKLKEEMQALIQEGNNLTGKLLRTKLQNRLKVILSCMLEDL